MKKSTFLVVILAAVICCVSCGHRAPRQKSSQSRSGYFVGTPASENHLLDSCNAFIDSLEVGEECRLCVQKLTSIDGVMAAACGSCEDFLSEETPATGAFFIPGPSLKPSSTVTDIQNRYNCIAVLNRVLHAFQWYERMALSVEDTVVTRQDTLDWVAASQPRIPTRFLDRAIPDKSARSAAKEFLDAYARFDGNTSESSDLALAFKKFNETISELPVSFASGADDALEAEFWDWYDKARFVPGIDDLIRLRLKDSGDQDLDSLRLERLHAAVLGETDVDRRAILALEYVKNGYYDGAELLGEILESGLYTRYLLECWISWRAHVQMDFFGASSYSVIPDNYYDMLRARCIGTLLEHYQRTADERDLVLANNFMCMEVLRRMGSIAGNESIMILSNLDYVMFIHPRVLGRDYLKGE